MANAHEEDVFYDEVYGVDNMDFDEENYIPLAEHFVEAIFYEDIPRITRLLDTRGVDFHGWGDFILENATDDGKTEIVRLLLEHGLKRGVDVGKFCNGSMYLAIRKGYDEIVKLLMEVGTDIHAGNDEALRLASHCGNNVVVKILLDSGADIHAQNNEALRLASLYGHVKIVKLLLDYGADTRSLHERANPKMREYIPVNRRRVQVVGN